MHGEEGQAVPFLVMIVCLAALAMLMVARAAVAEQQHQLAQVAADAAALAGAAQGEGGAQRLAAANGATLVTFRRAGAQVQVTVARRGQVATGTAELVASAAPP